MWTGTGVALLGTGVALLGTGVGVPGDVLLGVAGTVVMAGDAAAGTPVAVAAAGTLATLAAFGAGAIRNGGGCTWLSWGWAPNTAVRSESLPERHGAFLPLISIHFGSWKQTVKKKKKNNNNNNKHVMIVVFNCQTCYDCWTQLNIFSALVSTCQFVFSHEQLSHLQLSTLVNKNKNKNKTHGKHSIYDKWPIQ